MDFVVLHINCLFIKWWYKNSIKLKLKEMDLVCSILCGLVVFLFFSGRPKIRYGCGTHFKHGSCKYWAGLFRQARSRHFPEAQKENNDISVFEVLWDSCWWQDSQMQVLWTELFHCNRYRLLSASFYITHHITLCLSFLMGSWISFHHLGLHIIIKPNLF